MMKGGVHLHYVHKEVIADVESIVKDNGFCYHISDNSIHKSNVAALLAQGRL